MTKTLLGYGYTNAQGVATLDYDPNDDPIEPSGYHGTGAGHIGITAETVIDGSTLQETLNVLDALFYDTCTTGTTKTSTWFIYNNGVSTPVVSDDGMFIERTSSGNGYFVCNSQNMNTKPFTLDFAVEFDVVSISGDVRFLAVDGSWEPVGSISANDHYKVEFYSNKQVVTKNNGNPTEYTKSNSGNQGVRFQFVGVASIKIKEFKAYSI